MFQQFIHNFMSAGLILLIAERHRQSVESISVSIATVNIHKHNAYKVAMTDIIIIEVTVEYTVRYDKLKLLFGVSIMLIHATLAVIS